MLYNSFLPEIAHKRLQKRSENSKRKMQALLSTHACRLSTTRIQRAWRQYVLRQMATIRKLVLALDAARRGSTIPASSLFTAYMTQLLRISRHLRQLPSDAMPVLLFGLIAGAKVTRMLRDEVPTKRLWDAFDAAHRHLRMTPAAAAVSPLTLSHLLTPDLALRFLDAASAWLAAHSALENRKQAIMDAALQWVLVAKTQRASDDVDLITSYEHAYLQLNKLLPCCHVSALQHETVQAFLPLPDSFQPFVSFDDASCLRWPGLNASFPQRQRSYAPPHPDETDAALVHALLLDPYIRLPSTLPLDLTSVYGRMPSALDSEIDLRAAREAMWRTIKAELKAGVPNRAEALHKAITGHSKVLLDVARLQAMLQAKEEQLATDAQARLQCLKCEVLQEGSGPAHATQLFRHSLELKRFTLLDTAQWLKNVMPYFPLTRVHELAQCDPLALKEAHAFAIVATLAHPELTRSLHIELFRYDRLDRLTIATLALILAFQEATPVVCAPSAVVLYLASEAVGTTAHNLEQEHRQLLMSLDHWSLAKRVSDFVRYNAQVHWSIYQSLFPLLAKEYLLHLHKEEQQPKAKRQRRNQTAAQVLARAPI
jgi:hypothetical protein